MATLNHKSATRLKLLDHGVAMLMSQGYHGTGIKQVLDAVKVPKGSFYNYFESKEYFGCAVIAHYIEPFIARVNGHLAQPDRDALEALGCYYGELIAELEENRFQGGCLLGNLMGEIGDTSDLCRQALSRAVNGYRDTLTAGIASAQRSGSARTDLSAEMMADLLLNQWQGALLRMKIEGSAAPLKACCDHLLRGYFLRAAQGGDG